MNIKNLRHTLTRPALLVAAIAGLASLPACRTVVVDGDTNNEAGLAEVKLGELQVVAPHDFETVYKAAKKGIADRKLFLTQDDKKYIEAELKARDSVDTAVIVKIKEIGKDRVSVKIRYGVGGDVPNARALYSDISKHY